MSIRALIFDIGGVFFPWPGPRYFTEWAYRHGVAPAQLEQLLWHSPDVEAANVGVITAEEYCRRCAARLGAGEEAVRALIEGAFAGEAVNDALTTYVRSLPATLRIAALTNNWSFGRDLIEKRGIADLFNVIVTSAEAGVCKPDVRIYRAALDYLGVEACEAVFVDDSEEYVEAARELGMCAIQFISTEQVTGAINQLLAQPRRTV
jgi:putative hydrolase of the HAD superfamily